MYITIHHKSIVLQCAFLLFEHLVAVENRLKLAKIPLWAAVFTESALYQPLNNYQCNTHPLNSTLLYRKQSYPLKETTWVQEVLWCKSGIEGEVLCPPCRLWEVWCRLAIALASFIRARNHTHATCSCLCCCAAELSAVQVRSERLFQWEGF